MFEKYEGTDATVFHGNCLEVLSSVPDESIDLIFADPPYNIGKKFGEFKDSWPSDHAYAEWCYQWLEDCLRKLKPTGSLYVMASTQAMPYLDLWLRERIHILSRIVWHYDSSGVQAKKHFGSLYEPILYCVKDAKNYTFNATDIEVEARTGAVRKLIDYRKKVPMPYKPTKVPGNTWYLPRVRYRMPEYEDHPSQKPEALLERIIKASSHPGDLVLDPFGGTFTTCTVAQRLGRRSIGIELQADYVKTGLRRLGIATHFNGEPLQALDKTCVRKNSKGQANFRRTITAENLVEDFGRSSATGREVLQALSNVLADALGELGNPKTKMLFEEWAALYGQVAGLSIQQHQKLNGSLGFTFDGPAHKGLPAELFATHTFHALLMKLIAAEIAAAHGMASGTSLVHDLLALDTDEALLTALREKIENGGFFEAVDLHGFVDGAFFSWYLDAASKKITRTPLSSAIRALLAQLSGYRFDVIEKAGRSRDVLRDFYQGLVPEELRKSLGEFYTPDWLVEHSVAKLGYSDAKWLAVRVLDPTCGSGSFLLEAIEQKRRVALAAGWDAGRTVEMLTTTVWGFDLNPLAVQSARANFLIAIADLLQQCKGKAIEIPILLADAVYSPTPPPVGQFDAIVGNPPWVRWSNLPEAYRNRAKPTCERYGIFSDTKFHGGNELDISAIITYTAADKWLVEEGRLVFVLPQTVFQSPSSQGFRRFRINATDCLVPLSIDDMKALKPFPDAANKTCVALFSKKIQGAPTYPLDYRVWIGKPKTDNSGNPKKGRDGQMQRLTAIDPRLPRSDVLGLVDVIPMEANPVSDTMEGAPWAVMKPGHFAGCKPLFGVSTWVHGRKGITTDLNGVYFVDVIDSNEKEKTVKVRTRPQEGKTDLGPPRDFWVEAQSLYPLAKGAGDLHPCYFLPEKNLYAVVPNKGIDRASLDEAAANCNACVNPKTFEFFNAYKEVLEGRSTFRTRMKGAPFFSIYNVGGYTFAPFKVIWAEMTSNFAAAVVASGAVPGEGSRVYVPDHKLYFADFQEPEPAYFLCGLLHAEIVKEMIEAHNVSTSMGDIFKHIRLPQFDPSDVAHLALAHLVKQAHGEHDATIRYRTVAQVRSAAARLIETEIRLRSRHVG